MKRILIVLLASLLLLVGCQSTNNANNGSTLTIGVVQLAQHPALDAAYQGMVNHLNEELGEDKITIIHKNAGGQLTNADSIVQQFINDDVDLIYAIATNAAQSAANQTKNNGIPVVFNAVTDPVSAHLVKSLDNSENNITGVSDTSPLNKQLAIVKEILPNAKNVGVLYNIGEVNSKVQIEDLSAISTELGLTIVSKGVSNEAELQLAAEQLVREVDAIYNITDNMIVAATSMIVSAANKVKIPVFASEDGQLEQGILAAESLSYYQLGQEGAKIIIDILVNGKAPQEIPVYITDQTELFINLEQADNLGITLPESILNRGN